MEFGVVAIGDALGAILAHGVRVGEKRLKKGRVLSEADLDQLRAGGVSAVTVARLDSSDTGEDLAATRVAALCGGDGVRTGAAFTGRVNLYALSDGVALIDRPAIDAANAIDEAVTVATVAPYTRVTKGQMMATIKIIPFAAPKAAVDAAERVLRERGAPVKLQAFAPHHAALISTVLPGTKPSLLDRNRVALEDRLTSLGSSLALERRVAHDHQELADALREAVASGANPILVFGASAITDRRDVIPAAITTAGGEVVDFGMPVDPGNLLLLGTLAGRTVVGLPSCARSPKLNGFDFVLWRLLAGLPVGRREIAGMGVGGLLTEIPTRPQPRDERPLETPRLPRIGAIVLAAGLSSRMGSNKLLATVSGKPLVRHAVEAALGSAAAPVVVVTGNGGPEVRQAVAPLAPVFVENHDFSKGLSTSLRVGLRALPADCDGALVLLGDMPQVTSALLDKLIAAFEPGEDRAICVATRHGKRGNPVLWARRFFPEMLAIEGDVGARHLIGQYADLVVEVEATDDGPLTDIDTPEALAAYQAREIAERASSNEAMGQTI
ncbi:MAG: molybdopterin-binding/glycosyltransferase family 2 protein [Alphaproteobacteria bacterium]|nr:molybdopterin-binding/glycosyltransferase family 2 protein [Alphaproteobacteria bacterium]MBL6936555.1 molybdopterin-binding/glycosyltransferase family 2 protein [Alphaproteobacteria bacterium]MBL7098394.1 molybdopterin-binding/glycosyltransferase family 2 protein [Alphaproteobacteria bacterium]